MESLKFEQLKFDFAGLAGASLPANPFCRGFALQREPFKRLLESQYPVINSRRYGSAPFRVAVIHGGPGASGEMAAVAQELCSFSRGVLEPLQTGRTLQDQVEELKSQLLESADPPVTLIGFSWGAWLSLILAAHCPDLVDRLILVGCGPFLELYVPQIMETRLSRLSGAGKDEAICLLAALEDLNDAADEDIAKSKNRALARMGELFSVTDSFDPIECESDKLDPSTMECDAGIYQAVWKEAAQLRRNGELMAFCKKIQCPVVAIHGDWDPHPSGGVQEPLQTALKSFRFILLEDCGHMPWLEKRAKDKFYSILRELLDE